MDFIPSAAVLLQFTLASIVLTLTPGPDMTLFVGRSLSDGRAAGLACMAGASTGLVVHTVFVVAGLSALIVASPAAFLAVKITGAGYLVWLAVQAIRHGSTFTPRTLSGKARPLWQHWATGLGVNLLNPKIIIFFMTFLPQFVSVSDPYAPQKLMFLGLYFIALALPITIPMILAAHGFSSLMRRNPRVTRMVDWLFAGVFSAFAAKILLTQAR